VALPLKSRSRCYREGSGDPLSKNRIRILCVDDHRLVLAGLELLIERQPDMTHVGSATTGEEAVSLFRQHRPDITLMDLQLPVMSGLEAIRLIRHASPDARIIVLTMYHGDEDIHKALAAGASTFLLKDMLSEALMQVIREVHAGKGRLLPDVQTRLDERATRRSLTSREVQVTELIALGRKNREIAAELGISEETVQVHVKSILTKLGVNDRTAAVYVAMRRGIIHLAP
jgi:DNA-binding NarL/FixJ family response regulator